MIFFEQEQILLHIPGDRLVEEQQGAVDVQPVAENSGCQSMVGADPTESNNMPGAVLAGFSQDKLQLSDFIAAVHRATPIIAFHPEIFESQPI
jgi:hypothetical protein